MGCGSMQVADGDGERIRRVRWLGNLIEMQKTCHHLLHLMFFCAPVSYHRGFNGERRIFRHFESGTRSRQHRHSADLAKLQCGFHIDRVENIFKRYSVWTMLGNNFAQTSRNLRQPRCHRFARRNFDGAADDAYQPIIVAAIGDQVDYSVTGIFRSAINAEHTHVGSLAGALNAKLFGIDRHKDSQQHFGMRDFASSFSRRKAA